MHSVEEELPDILPTDTIVDEETFRYQTNQGDNGIVEQFEYTLTKAPVKTVRSVTGVTNGKEVTFTEDEDYELSADSTTIIWQESGKRPDAGTEFTVTYRSESVMSRYIQSHNEEYEQIEDELKKIEERRLLSQATGRDLERIGQIFGTLGQRFGRDDEQYRIYLKSIFQSFISNGTRDDIKTAITAATDVPKDDIVIKENFADKQYNISIVAATPVSNEVLEEVAEIADPSGVKLGRTRFVVPDDSVIFNDAVSKQTPTSTSDSASVTDSTTVPPSTDVSDSFFTTDGATVQTPTTATDTLFSSDTALTQTPTTATETVTTGDAVTIEEVFTHWTAGDWETMQWL